MEELRKKYLKKVKRIVVKIGSSSLTSPVGGLDLENLQKFTGEVSKIRDNNLEIIIVSSGAIAAGLKYLNLTERPKKYSILQAVAAVGQHDLMRVYSSYFFKNSKKVGQILVTREDTSRREQYLNIKNTIMSLLDLDVIPIINENDSVALDEIKFGDNDTLAALIAGLIEADLLVILSDIDGLFDNNPQDNADAKLISLVDNITEEIEKVAGGIGSRFGSGGMATKIRSAKICSFSGIPMVIANSRQHQVIQRILEGENLGTFFIPEEKKRITGMKRWIAFGMVTKGSLKIDKGAEEAIVKKGRSLLPVGVITVDGCFKKGDNIIVVSADARIIAKGISNLASENINMIKGKHEIEICNLFGPDLSCEVIHRDNLVVF